MSVFFFLLSQYIERIIRENREVLRNGWDAFCGGDTYTG